jgi:glyoxylase-like metal-dependent hydrolase (beta-lactamase superfamily II)
VVPLRAGRHRVVPIVEIARSPTPATMLTASDPALYRADMAWLAPEFVDPATGELLMSYHSWLIDDGRRRILVDPCNGNHKPRPAIPEYDRLDTDWPDRLAASGVRCDEIDLVVCTHLHPDHCGWNTRLDDGRWVPTFPNARYLASAREYDFWAARTDDPSAPRYMDGVLADSVEPVRSAGLLSLFDEALEIGDGFALIPAPGHTAGHSAAVLSDGDEGFVFCGDALHHPLQILFPRWDIRSAWNPAVALATRRTLLDRCARSGHLLAPGHFRGARACRVAGSLLSGFAAVWPA